MVSTFAAADAKSSAAVSRFFGELLELHPWTVRDYGAALADPSREVATFRGTFGGAMGTQKMGGDRGGNQGGSGFDGSVTVRDRVVTADLRDWPVHAQKRDRIRALDQPGQPWFEIVSINNDGVNRAVVQLVTL